MFEAIHRVKVIGRAIGAGDSDDSRDGDGDGFYAIKPGAPDKTPVPFKSINTVKKFAAIEKSVIAKHGPLKTNKDIRVALAKAFPKAKIEFGKEDDSDAPNDKRGHVIGLLHAASENPKAANALSMITRKGDVKNAGKYKGVVLLQYDRKSGGLRLDLNPSGYGDGIAAETVARRLELDAKDLDPETRDRLLNAYVSIHEFGHVAHFEAMMRDANYDPNDAAGLLVELDVMSGQMADMQRSSFEQTVRSQREQNPDMAFSSDEEIAQGAVLVLMNNYKDELFEKLIKRWSDGLSSDEALAARNNMGEISKYGKTNPLEGFAEMYAARSMGVPYEASEEVQRLIDWTSTKTAKTTGVGLVQILLCDGLKGKREQKSFDLSEVWSVRVIV